MEDRRGQQFVEVDLSGALFKGVDLTDVTIKDAWVHDVTISGDLTGLSRPVTVQDRSPVVLQVWEPVVFRTVYPVIGDPPSSEGGVQVTVASPSPATASTLAGAPGAYGFGTTAAHELIERS